LGFQLIQVRLIRTVWVLSVVGLWLGMNFHCRLESVPGLEFMSCEASHVPENPADTHCDDNACRTIEAGHFTQAIARVSPERPAASAALAGRVAPEPELQPVAGVSAPPATVPPDLPRAWQFLCRAALPPRAPSTAV
jgi:hypothetical protein